MSANTTSTQPLIKLLYHLKLACLLVLVSFSPWKNGIPCTSSAAARMSTTCTTVIAVTLALGTAYTTSTGGAGVQCSTVASVEGRLYELRLVGSNATNEGLLQVFMNNRWGWVYSYTDALHVHWRLGEVACHQMGYEEYSNTGISVDESVKQQPVPWLMARVKCSGYESRLVDCGHINFTSTLVPGEQRLHVPLKCIKAPALQNDTLLGSLRLVSSSQSSTKGRIEIYGNQSRWGTICDDYWTDKAATVACRQMRLGSIGISHGNAFYGSGEGPILLDDVQCNGDEERLLQCDTSPLGEHNCIHAEDAGVECFDHMPTVAPNKGMKIH
ncbi:deleted in malignant brain tumors 1 protein-like isoform X2 [Lytechinus variegatus]|uniref:deleted in malignant brain tumors 1 protein-like isoform X2 n=1 Tax=Lytechinus variegatus TaxID=7654 RepID=UPI001BB1183E|nr:deleted in malignant brain tumors 1 protein-like isoform X2 [Lytechinus variegatus]XP_041455375.1 deleted in malignant brain tumors 1 protein-like isoform X2 [Lytechinus variegatus]